jgi:hypothetical protein
MEETKQFYCNLQVEQFANVTASVKRTHSCLHLTHCVAVLLKRLAGTAWSVMHNGAYDLHPFLDEITQFLSLACKDRPWCRRLTSPDLSRIDLFWSHSLSRSVSHLTRFNIDLLDNFTSSRGIGLVILRGPEEPVFKHFLQEKKGHFILGSTGYNKMWLILLKLYLFIY